MKTMRKYQQLQIFKNRKHMKEQVKSSSRVLLSVDQQQEVSVAAEGNQHALNSCPAQEEINRRPTSPATRQDEPVNRTPPPPSVSTTNVTGCGILLEFGESECESHHTQSISRLVTQSAGAAATQSVH